MDFVINQYAYVTDDLHASAERHTRLFGSGPWYIVEHPPVAEYTYRGQPASLDVSVALGQWGDTMIEFLLPHTETPTHISEMFPVGSGRGGLQHVGVIVDGLEAAIQRFDDAGFGVVAWERIQGVDGLDDVVFIDTVPWLGYQVELYDSVAVRGLYGLIRGAAVGFDPTDLSKENLFRSL